MKSHGLILILSKLDSYWTFVRSAGTTGKWAKSSPNNDSLLPMAIKHFICFEADAAETNGEGGQNWAEFSHHCSLIMAWPQGKAVRDCLFVAPCHFLLLDPNILLWCEADIRQESLPNTQITSRKGGKPVGLQPTLQLYGGSTKIRVAVGVQWHHKCIIGSPVLMKYSIWLKKKILLKRKHWLKNKNQKTRGLCVS